MRHFAFQLKGIINPDARLYVLEQAEQQQLHQIATEFLQLKGGAAAAEAVSGELQVRVSGSDVAGHCLHCELEICFLVALLL